MTGKKKEINIGIVGAGGRSGLAKHLFNAHDNVKLRAIYDPDKKIMEERLKFLNSPDAKRCNTYEEVTHDKSIDWVMVFSPNCYHCEHILSAFDAGKNVFAEKPLATTIEDCEKIYKAHKKSNLVFATGFVLRYAPLYRKVRELLDAGEIGKIISIDANDNFSPALGSYIMKNWRRFKKFSGPHILEKCCHDIDLLNWFVGSVPSKIASFGGRNFFIPENQHMFDKFKDQEGKSLFEGWADPHGEKSPFTAEKDIMDNQIAILEYRNNIRVMFQATFSNAIPERRMYFSGTEGTMIAELYTGELHVRRIGEESVRVFQMTGGGHAGGDEIIMKEFYETMATGKEPRSSGNEGLESAVTAIAIEDAKDKMQVLDLEPIWKKLGR